MFLANRVNSLCFSQDALAKEQAIIQRASATETVDTGSIPGLVKPRLQKLLFTSSLLDVQQLKGQCEASSVCGRLVGRWQLDSKSEKSLHCFQFFLGESCF